MDGTQVVAMEGVVVMVAADIAAMVAVAETIMLICW